MSRRIVISSLVGAVTVAAAATVFVTSAHGATPVKPTISNAAARLISTSAGGVTLTFNATVAAKSGVQNLKVLAWPADSHLAPTAHEMTQIDNATLQGHLADDRDVHLHPRPARLDAHARPERQAPVLGAPPSATPPVHRSRATRHHRPPTHPPPRPALAPDHLHHGRPRTARPTAEPRLTSRFPAPTSSTTSPEQWNPAPTRHDSRAIDLPITQQETQNGPPTPSTDRHARSRLRNAA